MQAPKTGNPPNRSKIKPKPMKELPPTDPDFWPGSYKDRRMKLEWALDSYYEDKILPQATENFTAVLRAVPSCAD